MDKMVNGNNIEMTAEEVEAFLASQAALSVPKRGDYEAAIDFMLDECARDRNYRSGERLAGYAASTVPQWADEAATFIAFRDEVWSYALTELAKVETGQRAIPTVQEFLTELPTISWPE